MIKQSKKKLLLEFVDYHCESCNKIFDHSLLEVHRLKRRGSYLDFRNLKILCKDCHKKYHQGEFNHIGGKNL
jgi:hypothetical protein